MQKAMILVSLLVLGWTWTLEGLPLLPEPLYPTQENFDLARFLGTWHDIALATPPPHLHGRDLAIGKLLLEASTTEGKLMTTRSILRHGICKEMTGDYELTTTPGRLFYHIAGLETDVDAYVVHTNYIEYAIVISIIQKLGDTKTTVKLYSRTMDVRPTVLEDFKTLVKQMGMTDDAIIIRADKGECVPGEQVEELVVVPEPQRMRRSVVPSLPAEDLEGSGDIDGPLFDGAQACKAEPEVGPCFGSHQRYFYNSSSMSCEHFKYGGCLGNQNNFEDERECLQRCRTEAVCRLPMAAQPCTGQEPVWAFDSSAGLCVAYKLNFCQTNANKFYSKAECEEYCGVMREELLSV